ncbi:MAG: RNA-binding S4 domain-containing protein [Clostridia bacterium]|jgi:ribosomal 50S subunit-recycling heat shock protein|nr:RNA-binding S4 domain-containing protein [Clostridia bacterium]
MRLDKFLKVSRMIKRRTVANEACSAGKVTINDKVAKPSAEVKEGDIIAIRMGAKLFKAEVLSIREYATKEAADEMYRVISNE